MGMDWGFSASSCCHLGSDLGTRSSLQAGAYDVFDELLTSAWRSPSRALEVTIHQVRYPVTESVIHQIFSQFGKVEEVHVFGEPYQALFRVVFSLKHDAADAFGELHGRYIYDGCCQMEIKWGLPQEPDVAVLTREPVLFSSAVATMTTSDELISEKLVVAVDASEAHTGATVTVPAHSDIYVAVPNGVNRGGINNSLQGPIWISDVAVASITHVLTVAAGNNSVVPLITVSDAVGFAVGDELLVPAVVTNATSSSPADMSILDEIVTISAIMDCDVADELPVPEAALITKEHVSDLAATVVATMAATTIPGVINIELPTTCPMLGLDANTAVKHTTSKFLPTEVTSDGDFNSEMFAEVAYMAELSQHVSMGWSLEHMQSRSMAEERFRVATTSIQFKLPWFSFDPGPLFQLGQQYCSPKCDSLPHTLPLLLDGEIIQRECYWFGVLFDYGESDQSEHGPALAVIEQRLPRSPPAQVSIMDSCPVLFNPSTTSHHEHFQGDLQSHFPEVVCNGIIQTTLALSSCNLLALGCFIHRPAPRSWRGLPYMYLCLSNWCWLLSGATEPWYIFSCDANIGYLLKEVCELPGKCDLLMRINFIMPCIIVSTKICKSDRNQCTSKWDSTRHINQFLLCQNCGDRIPKFLVQLWDFSVVFQEVSGYQYGSLHWQQLVLIGLLLIVNSTQVSLTILLPTLKTKDCPYQLKTLQKMHGIARKTEKCFGAFTNIAAVSLTQILAFLQQTQCDGLSAIIVGIFVFNIELSSITWDPGAKYMLFSCTNDHEDPKVCCEASQNGYQNEKVQSTGYYYYHPCNESHQHKHGGAFIEQIAFQHKFREHDLSSEQDRCSLLWDPGGFELLHRLASKPILKKGGMSVAGRLYGL